MISRRQFMTGIALGSAGGALLGIAIKARNTRKQYEALLERTWRRNHRPRTEDVKILKTPDGNSVGLDSRQRAPSGSSP